ncbi:hypothetical protein JMJ77_0007683 [Colletotrichum scovillei]|uniref:Uncharacterized protein n=1 Tax=Colletotrichum scovillei TaxID=1209932 RepID=A0A9P7RDB7_9PEZI|nr:hypothetical protein JMJ77_0007683 [Colletotrichum scovillei]KAG7074662.1 hypothetical protein JMJ76_0011136 [Colletotrichum scovillei]KAG7081811.1 hypothetical protein JMJ78_0003924 [Colletotrichum scovillei]
MVKSASAAEAEGRVRNSDAEELGSAGTSGLSGNRREARSVRGPRAPLWLAGRPLAASARWDRTGQDRAPAIAVRPVSLPASLNCTLAR